MGNEKSRTGNRLSIIRGIPLRDDPDKGVLTIGGYVRERTQRFGDLEAVVDYSGTGTVRWTYNDLWHESIGLARTLMAHGVVKGTRVGLLMTNRREFLSAFFGTALAGGVAVPLSTFSTPPELDHLLQSSACAILLLESRVLETDYARVLLQLEPALATAESGRVQSIRFPFLRHLAAVDRAESVGAIASWADFTDAGEAVSPELVAAAAATVAPADPGAIFFSSGSTALPKGIQVTHRAVALQIARWKRLFGLDSDTRVWTANGMFWSGTFSCSVGSALSTGGTLVLQQSFDPEEALALMERERINFPLSWPHQWARLLDAANWQQVDLSAMRYVNPRTPIARHPTVSTDWDEPIHAYGSSETFTTSAIYPSGTPGSVTLNSAGTPLPGNVFKIVDPDTGETVAMGERGEIAVKGPTLMLGYLGIPLDESLDHEGFFRTGDGGYVDADNRLFWEGRLSDIIKTGGANVSPVEVDTVLNKMPGIRVGQVVGLPHDTLGEIVVACIATNEGVCLGEDEVKAYLKQRLASYKVPRRILFFEEQQLKKTGSEKIRTADLRALAGKRMRADDSDED